MYRNITQNTVSPISGFASRESLTFGARCRIATAAVRAHEAAAYASRLARRVARSGDPRTPELAQCEDARNGELRHCQQQRRHEGPEITDHHHLQPRRLG
jgi:hypothetical protein